MKKWLLFFCLIISAGCFTTSARTRYKYMLAEIPGGQIQVHRLSKDSAIYFNTDSKLRDVRFIGPQTFEMNPYLREEMCTITLPDHLEVIPPRTFAGCNIERDTFEGSPGQIKNEMSNF